MDVGLTLETARVLFMVGFGVLLLIFAVVGVIELVTNREPKSEPKEPAVTGVYADRYVSDDPFEENEYLVRIVDIKRNSKGVLYVQYVHVKHDGTDYGMLFSGEWSEFQKRFRPV